MKNLFFLFFVAGTLLVGCAYQPLNAASDPPGFFMGILHGAIAPFALIVGFFSDVRIYAFPNSGWWYDFGFMLGISSYGGAAVKRY
jgi:hypothetical protein